MLQAAPWEEGPGTRPSGWWVSGPARRPPGGLGGLGGDRCWRDTAGKHVPLRGLQQVGGHPRPPTRQDRPPLLFRPMESGAGDSEGTCL